MRWIFWLDHDDRTLLETRIHSTIPENLRDRKWGDRIAGVSPGGAPHFSILDVRGLFLSAGILSYTLDDMGYDILFRGQSRDWEPIPTLYRGAQRRAEIDRRTEWLTDVLASIDEKFDPSGTTKEREALAGHYQLPTRWLDVVDHIQTAAWFACEGERSGKRLIEGQADDGVGYILIFAVPRSDEGIAEAIDLRLKPSEWLRPHVQQAWALRSTNPRERQGSLYFLHLATFVVPKPLLNDWSARGELGSGVMFPNQREDQGFHHWLRAEESLRDDGLLPEPW